MKLYHKDCIKVLQSYVGTVEFADGSFSVMCEHASPFLDQAVSKHGAYIIGNMHDILSC